MHDVTISQMRQFFERMHYPESPSFLVAALEDIQAHYGWVPDSAIVLLAEYFSLSAADVHQLIDACPASFTRTAADLQADGQRLRVCHGPVCCAHGSDALFQALKSQGLTPSKQACLGVCDHAPAVQYGEQIMAPASEESMIPFIHKTA